MAGGEIADEQEEAVRGLVQPTVAQVMPRQRAAGPVFEIGAGIGPFQVAAILEQPIPLQLRTARPVGQGGGDVLPSDSAVLLHVAVSDAVGHALVAERVNQPIENGGRFVPLHGGDHPVPRQADPGVVD